MKKTIVLTLGLPGSGKSTFLRNYLALKPHVILCPDQIREEVTGNIEDQSQNGRVFDIFYDRLEAVLKDPDIEYIGLDATFLRKAYRTPVFETIKDSNIDYEIIVLYFDLTKEQAMNRMKNRTRQVPEYVIDSMIQKFCPITTEEKEKYNISNVITIDIDTPVAQEGFTGFIGDIHSCYKELEKLLYQLGFYKENGEWYNSGACQDLIFLGDHFDRGYDSIGVLKTIMQLNKKGWSRSVMGNHDSKLLRYLCGNPVKPSHGLNITIEHLSTLSDSKLVEVKDFLTSLPPYIEVQTPDKKYVAAHAYFADWMVSESANPKTVKDLCMYGVKSKDAAPDEPSRLDWWEDPKHQSKESTVVFGHYWKHIDLPHAKCVDFGCCTGQELGAFVTNGAEERWVTVKSDFNYKEVKENPEVKSVLTYKELFTKLKNNPEEIIDEIENDDLLNKRRYNVSHNNETFELTIANASKGLFSPDTNSYAQQLAKGIVYNKHTKEIVSVTLPKFYNYGEKDIINDALADFIKSGKYQFQFVEKLDGTQIARFVYRGKVFWNTRSIIISEDNTNTLSEDSTDFYKFTLDAVNASGMHHYLDPNIHSDKTLIFELLHPDNLTIVPYGNSPKLSLLSYSQKNEQGLWESMYTVNNQMNEFDLPTVYSAQGSIDEAAELLKTIEDREGIAEGFVANVIDENGKVHFRIKFKTPSFFEAMRLTHHCTYDRVIEVCTGHSLNTKEEFIEYLKKDKDAFPEELLEKYQKLFDDYKEYTDSRDLYANSVKEYFEKKVKPMSDKGDSRRDIALSIKDYPFASHLFNLLDNKPLTEDLLNKFFKFDKDEVLLRLEPLSKVGYRD